ncbi:MAG: FAD-dependent oxidoreductase [Thermoguttaceae bacterium]|nr:FAD-dependent oxidoreductase [Thermoguttaceae bacterium]
MQWSDKPNSPYDRRRFLQMSAAGLAAFGFGAEQGRGAPSNLRAENKVQGQNLAAGQGRDLGDRSPPAPAAVIPSASPSENPRVEGGYVMVPARKTPVLAEADVVVCGGGPAGVAAACSAARRGAKVILLERWPSVGGMATNALVNIWHTSDRTKQVIYGLVQEAIERGGRYVHRYPNYPHQYETHWFDPEAMRLVFHQMLEEAKVRTFCGLQAVESVVEDGRIRGVLVDSKRGRRAVLGRVVIDATGDGDLAANAGLPFDFGRPSDGRLQGMTMMYRLIGLDPAQATPEGAARTLARMRQLRQEGKFPPFFDKAAEHYLRHPPAWSTSLNMCPVSGNPLDEEELTRLSVQARRQVYQYVDLWRAEAPGFQKAEVVQMGFSLGIRESRRVRGLKTLDAQMILNAQKQPDALGHGFWMIDIHDPLGSGHTTWAEQNPRQMLPPGQSYHIPLGMCLNRQIPNLAVVGRCASATHEALASVRIQTHCMVMGQGVGVCAALALQTGCDLAQVDLGKLQAALRTDGVYLEDVPK